MNDATELLRQIHPSFVKLGKVTSQAFRPTPKDDNKLSVYDGDLISPAKAWAHFHERSHESVGVMAVTVADCKEVNLPVRSTPEVFDEHAEIDFSELSGNQRDTRGKLLRNFAEKRGWLFRPES